MLGTILAIVGLLITLVFVLADVLGLGYDPNAFGQRQVTGTAVGIVVFLVGFILRRRASGAGAGGE
jgi:hypothetical protein